MKKMLQILVLMLAMWMAFTLVPSAQAAEGDVKVVIDGESRNFNSFDDAIEPMPFNSDRIQAIMVNPGASTQEAKFVVYDTELETFLYQDVDFLTDYVPHD